MKYKVRSNDGRVRMETNDRDTANRHARQTNGYVRKTHDGYNPFREEGHIGQWGNL